MESHCVICLFLLSGWTDNLPKCVVSVSWWRGVRVCVNAHCMFTTLWLTLLRVGQLHSKHRCVCIGSLVCDPQRSSVSAFHLEQQLVLHDPLDRFDEQVVQLQPVAQLLPQLLTAVTDTNNTTPVSMTAAPQRTAANGQLNPSQTIHRRDYTVCLSRVDVKELITIWIINGRGKDTHTAMYNI